MTVHLDKQHPIPVYLQLKQVLQHQIEQGVYRCHQRLPSERYLCEQYDLSRMTARRALQALIAEGLAYTRVGKGTFVNQVSTGCNGNGTSLAINNGHHASNSLEQTCKQLITEFVVYNAVEAETLIKQSLATYSVEAVVTDLLLATIQQIENHQPPLSVQVQTFAFTTIRSELIALINATPNPEGGIPMVLAGAPTDMHEMGLLVLHLYLRRRGFTVTYLGPNTQAEQFFDVINAVQPRLVCFSAATVSGAEALVSLSKTCAEQMAQTDNRLKTQMAFGGNAFQQKQSLIEKIHGIYLGHTIDDAVAKVVELFAVEPSTSILG